MSTTLSRSTLDTLAPEHRPLADPRDLEAKVVHFGLGAFHRAHQAVYTEAAGQPWGIAAVAPRSPWPVEALRAQDCLFSVADRGPAGGIRVVGSIVEALEMVPDAGRVDALLTSPEVTVVTLTVTEKGYFRDPRTGRLDTTDPAIAADLAGAPPRTVIGRLTTSLESRFRTSGAPVNVVSCDNAAGNGAALKTVLTGFAAAARRPEAFLRWLDESVAFPSTVVDRIVPAVTGADREAAATALGVRDEMTVAGEPYRQWVIEDSFAASRPRWEADGALLVPDVAPHQLMKLRLLNGAHSAMAYLGLAAGCRTVADVLATGWGEALVRGFTAEVAPTLPDSDLDVPAYVNALVERFANPAIGHELRQIGSDGSLKIAERWLPVLRERGGTGPVLALALAAWAHATRRPHGTTDPAAAELAACWDAPGDRTALARLLTTVGGADLAEDPAVVAAIADNLPAVRAGRVTL
ncbi:mannitol dehydrogenase family protein [Amycolatopsis endophytica]|uniref:Mannitol-1-phosphate 5-dehydrogenase n=1 Tax=Amycolatopsis endophytica TaxID=860233 RepID=A0A853BCU7_9PSEU|nr:mannitol dehydrogenase family protein [Amycolatopsis endophytica]NYI92552.1 fructuronate reductase [Amycolatopsis endophytica]